MLEDTTEIEENYKQESLNTILFNINQMYEYATESDTVSLEFDSISLQDIDKYLKKIYRDQDTSIKLFTVNATNIFPLIEAPQLIDDNFIYPKEFSGIQNIYFIEGGEFALTLLPVLLDEKTVCVIIQPLEISLPFIKNEYNKIIEKRYRKNKSVEELKKEIPFVKFSK